MRYRFALLCLGALSIGKPEGATGPLAGVEVCELDTNNCVTTNESGNAVLEVPAEQDVAVTYVKEGYAKYVNMLVVPAGGIGEPTGMATDQRFQEMHQLVGSPYPMEGTGTVFIDIVNRYEGATLSLVGDATGKAWYRDEELDWDPDLTESTAGGGGNEHGGPRMTSGAAAD